MPEDAGSNPAPPTDRERTGTEGPPDPATGPAWNAGERQALRVRLPPLPLAAPSEKEWPMANGQWPKRTKRRSSVIGHRSSVIGHRSPVIGQRSSVMGDRGGGGGRAC